MPYVIYIYIYKYIEILFHVSKYREMLLENINWKYALETSISRKKYSLANEIYMYTPTFL